MTMALNERYKPPSRDDLCNTIIPAWYSVEKEVIWELAMMKKVAITCDGWSSLAQDHYVTVTVHYIHKGSMKVKALYAAQTGMVVAEGIKEVLEEFKISEKIAAATVDNASNMGVALRNLKFLKVGCFAHTLNLAAQKVYNASAVTKWRAKLREVVVWPKRSTMSKTVLREKQQLLSK